jgi:sugar phosphate permease
MAYTVGMAAALLALQATPAGATTLQWIAIAALGFTIYGPQMLIGLSGAELVSPGAVGASQGILGWIAYLGAANAGAYVSAGVRVGCRQVWGGGVGGCGSRGWQSGCGSRGVAVGVSGMPLVELGVAVASLAHACLQLQAGQQAVQR